MKIFKYIFRLDYKLFFNLVDQIGKTIDLVYNTFHDNNIKIDEQKTGSLNSVFIIRGMFSTGPFSLTLSSTTFAGNLEFENGLLPSEVSNSEFIKKCSSIFSESPLQSISDFERIGFRTNAISDISAFTYKVLFDYFMKKNDYTEKILDKKNPVVNDIGIILESVYKDDENMRINLGPYREIEKEKYFEIDPHIKEGLMLDLDLWQWKLKLPKLNLASLINKNNSDNKLLFEKIVSTFMKELQK